MQVLSQDYSRIERAILFLEENFESQPGLKEIARSANLSEYHFQRLFKRWAGITPKRFVQFLTLQRAKSLLNRSRSLLGVAYETGLSGPGRLHDLFVSVEAVTPGEFKANGAGLKITYGFHATPFGECLLAITERGLCGLRFVPDGKRERCIRQLKTDWKGAEFVKNEELTRNYLSRIFGPRASHGARPLTLCLKGTNFQIKVWEALLKIPSGLVVSYEELANRVGKPRGARAVGNAVAENPIAFLIPCHRVIRKSGIVGNYRWGTARKKAMLAWEAAKQPSAGSLGNMPAFNGQSSVGIQDSAGGSAHSEASQS